MHQCTASGFVDCLRHSTSPHPRDFFNLTRLFEGAAQRFLALI